MNETMCQNSTNIFQCRMSFTCELIDVTIYTCFEEFPPKDQQSMAIKIYNNRQSTFATCFPCNFPRKAIKG